jgi:hypothetical protein
MFRSVGVVILYLAGANAVLCTYARTCTPATVDALVSGGSISLLLFALALALLVNRPVPRRWWIVLLPAGMTVIYLGWWTGRFAFGVWAGQQNACELLTGTTGFEADGRERLIAGIYLATTAVAAIGLIWSWLRAAPGSSTSGHELPFGMRPQ